MFLIDGFHKLADWLDKITEVIIVVMLMAMVVITGAQIIFRVFFKALKWSEEATRYLLVWSSMFGASCVYRRSGHIVVTVFQDILPVRIRRFLKLLVHVLCMGLFALIIFYGIKYYGMQGKQLSASLRWPMRYVYLGVTIGGGLLFIQALDRFLTMLEAYKGSRAWEAEA